MSEADSLLPFASFNPINASTNTEIRHPFLHLILDAFPPPVFAPTDRNKAEHVYLMPVLLENYDKLLLLSLFVQH